MGDVENIGCPWCGHGFNPGATADRERVYCPSCGKSFPSRSTGPDTVSFPSPAAGNGPASPLPDSDSAGAGRSFGDYDLIKEIARGGMGVVYLARQRALRRVVALKLLRSGENASPEERGRLLREAKAAAGLSHPNIVPIHEFSLHRGQPYFTMDFIQGEPLDHLLEKGPMNVREAVGIMEEVAGAIAFAHSRGVVHRDVKPANIIIDERGRPMITDFGLAIELVGEAAGGDRMTLAGSVMGTLSYAPPEQAAGRIDQISELSDVYSMGAVLYEMLAGRPPFAGFTQFELIRRVINQDPEPPRRYNPRVSPDVETIVLKCLEKDPRRRYPSARAFADDCHSFLKGEMITARPATLAYRCRRFLQRRPLSSLLAAGVAVLSAALWFGAGRLEAVAREKEATERELVDSLARVERIALEKEETERRVRREWHAAYNLTFDYYFRWDGDPEKARREGIPWINPARARLLTEPPRLSLNLPPGSEDPGAGVDIGFPFALAREIRIGIRLQIPGDDIGELFILLDANRNYQPHPGSLTLSFGPPGRPGAAFRQGEAVIGENPTFSLSPDSEGELIIERADGRLAAYLDGEAVLLAEDPPPVFQLPDGESRLALGVRNGSLSFYDLSLELRGMSQDLAAGLIEIASGLAARGRSELALRLYANVLADPADPANRLRALRAYARLLWLALPDRERNPAGIRKACDDLYSQMPPGRPPPGEKDYLLGLALAGQFARNEGSRSLEQLERAAAAAYSSGNGEYGDLARLEALFVRLRLGMPAEAAKRFGIMLADGSVARLARRFGPELGAGGGAALILEKIEPLIGGKRDLDLAADLLRFAAAIAPVGRECAAGFRRLALIRIESGQIDSGLALLRQAEELVPDWSRPYLDEALVHFRLDRPESAEAVLARAAAAMPLSLDFRLSLARFHLEEIPEKQRDPGKLESAALAAVELSQGKNPAALEILALARERRGRFEEAIIAVEAALALEKTEPRLQMKERLDRLRRRVSALPGEARP
ncbi:MAG: protein kinase [Planctomycetota bacterium]|jgi:predicted Ser/Thr protein kinase/tetratricopeptide (TPR) repeat protein|nr:protein kinase [Planctomycetota bacterium]